MMRPFNITLDIGGMELNVKGNYDPGRPENKKGHPDTWTPAEGGELEVIEVSAGKQKLQCDTKKFRDRWEDQIIDAIEAK